MIRKLRTKINQLTSKSLELKAVNNYKLQIMEQALRYLNEGSISKAKQILQSAIRNSKKANS